MLRILYFSQAKGVISDDQMRDILNASRRKNPLLGISGVLIHGGGQFMQVLEGPERSVLGLYLKIMDDQRHFNSRIAYISVVNKRLFQEWSMGVIESDPLEFQHINELLTNHQESVQGKVFIDIMRQFRSKLKLATDSNPAADSL